MSAEVVPDSRSANEVLAASRTLVDHPLRDAVDALPESLRPVAGYHVGQLDEHGRATRAGGKALRPALAMLAAEAVGGTPESAVPAAVAVELVHNATLLHDDVVDGDELRRHRPTAWRVFGQAMAVLAGDVLMVRGLDVLLQRNDPAGVDAARILSTAAQEVLGGQGADIAFEGRGEVGMREVVRMAQAKTGALIRAACAIGATCGGGRPAQVAHLAAFGGQIGLAFQHVDDLLGIWGDPQVTGKPVYSDLRSRKKTLPVVAALTGESPAAGELGELYGRTAPLADAELVRAAQLVESAGGRTWSGAQADQHIAAALDQLAMAGLTARATAELESLARLVTRRDH